MNSIICLPSCCPPARTEPTKFLVFLRVLAVLVSARPRRHVIECRPSWQRPMRYWHSSKSDEKVHEKRCQCQSKAVARTQTPLHPLLRFQQTVGNRAVRRLIQARIGIKQPGDVYEQEADRVAEQVIRGRKISYRTSAADTVRGRIQRVCTECEQEEKKGKNTQAVSLVVQRQVDEEREEEPVQAKSINPDTDELQKQRRGRVRCAEASCRDQTKGRRSGR